MRAVRDVADLISGQHVITADVNANGDGVPYLTGPSDFVKSVPVATAWTTKGLKFCESGDVLVTVKGSGCGTLVRADRRYAISRQLMAIRAKHVDPSYLWCALQHSVRALANHAAGTIPGLTRDQILGIEVPVPQLGTEKSVATLVSIAEQMTERLTLLLAMKRTFKQSCTQQLFSGDRRLAEFTARPFKFRRFDSLCEEVSDRNHGRLGPGRRHGSL